jgi:hypothetical protein
MAFPGQIYAPPGVYTETDQESPLQGIAAALRIPLFMGEAIESLTREALELVRGSSSQVDQRIVQEDETGRAVVSISNAGQVTLGNFDGTLDRLQVRNYPIVTGTGAGVTATTAGSVNVTVNGSPVAVLAIDGVNGILRISVTPEATDEVRVTYFFNRTDTLITDTVSDQITPDAPQLYGEVGQNYDITTDVNDTLLFTVDSVDAVSVTISESPASGWTAAQVAAFINSAATGTSLVASSAENSFGETVLFLTADRDIEVGAGTANTTLGLTQGNGTSRNKVFYTFQGPIVDGSNGGVTTTDTADVTVKVNGTQVIPTAVDGQTRAVTLPFAPEVGATVTIQYFFNSWQDTFDYLENIGVTEITRVGLTPDRTDYINGSDYVLKEDRILWGAATLVEQGELTVGGTGFGSNQITSTLVDARQYLAECAAVVDQTVSPPVESRTTFTLPLTATTGNGRNSPLDTTTFDEVSNGRVDLPTNRPDLVFAYWGYSLSDAVQRGRVTVTRVESSTSQITLSEEVPVGATVYATFYYSTLQDAEYTFTAETAGGSGVGTYSVQDADGNTLYTPRFGSKSAALATIALQFPSGSESNPDTRFESPFDVSVFTGAVEEDVTITFASQGATLGAYTVPSSGPYYMVLGASENFDIEVDGSSLAGGFVKLSNPAATGAGFSAQLVGDVVSYDADSGGTTYDIDSTNRDIDLEVDGILIQAKANSSATGTAAAYATAINRASLGDFGAAQGGALGSITLAATASDIDDYYVGWTVRVTAGLANGDERTITDYDGTTKVATVGVNFSGAPAATDTYHVHDPATVPVIKSSTRFLAPVTITAGEYDALVLNYTGSTVVSTPINLTGGNVIAPGTYASVSALAAAVQTAMDAAITAAAIDIKVTVGSDSSGRLTFALTVDPTDTGGGFLEFVTGASTAVDFAVLAGLDTGAAQGGQAKLVNSDIARLYTLGDTPTLNDRLILRNRLVPGNLGSLDGQDILDLTQLEVLGGTGASQAGLTPNELGQAGTQATIKSPTARGLVGLSGGQVPTTTYGDARDGQPLVTFYADGGTTAQNNVLQLTVEGAPITVEFTDATGAAISTGGSADVPLGPVGIANTVLAQIQAALTAAGSTATLTQEGAGFRLRGASSASSATIVVGTGSANSVLGLSSGDVFQRTDVEVEVLVSALMAHTGATLAAALLSWSSPTATYFAAEALAKTVRDSANAEYLYLQSQGTAGAGTTSSVAIAVAATNSVTLPGTGLGVTGGEGGTGEDAVEGFYVTSSDTVTGSGTANTSVLNSGTGQDGQVGQTYRDAVTGLTFTILEREGGTSYPATATFTFTVRAVATADANLPSRVVPGAEVIVSNTLGVTVGDTAVVETYDRGGNEPGIGDLYYATYNYAKQVYTTQLFTRQATIVAAYGSLGTQNPLSLASYLALNNGAVILALRQVQRDTDTDGDGVNDSASTAAYLTALEDIEGPLPGGAFLNYITALKTDSQTLYEQMALHCDVQSSIRYRAERTAIAGFSAGTQPQEAGDSAEAIGRTRFRFLYPDIYTLTLDNGDGTSDSYLVDGGYMAAAWAGTRANPSIDVATPWTRRQVFAFDAVARVLDPVEQNQVAVRGVTVMTQERSRIFCRQGLTTDMTDILTKLPTVIAIADEVQRQSRSTLDGFSGNKFLAGITSQISSQLQKTLDSLQKAQIIQGYTGVEANPSPDDPTTVEAQAAYAPVFPLLYIVLRFSLRSSLT